MTSICRRTDDGILGVIFRDNFKLRLRPTILDLTGVQTLLVWALHAGIDSSTAVAHRVDGTLIMEARSVGDDLPVCCFLCLFLFYPSWISSQKVPQPQCWAQKWAQLPV